ncbi:MAG: cupin [Candidatus Wallbacteria bacterium HGW-Wallbacteria-1]|jgi:hypothetical protein|uniref:Cupin n=1 Tax=Candidatus Wallbacteria bacterium HGW-Wallbacteria-1 TaxID=2013854 RepID=A0A2N1PQV0_9BACT|nr:MAG: cupin [Candidatus Wallbacteria bacterium HGW-Wallbacteria-1]
MESRDGIIVRKPSAAEIESMGLSEWSTWSCEVSSFDWTYSDAEEAYVLEGVVVVTGLEEAVEITAGDLVFFPRGLSCQWDVKQAIKKVYRFL